MTKILLIDDDPTILELLKLFLEKEGYQVMVAESGLEGADIAAKRLPDLAIVDLMMPGLDGFETSRRLRELGVQSILVMSHRQDERSLIRSLEMGADDFLRKPFAVPIFLAKIRTLLRRNGSFSAEDAAAVYNDGQLLIDLDRRHVELRGKLIQLTPTEFRLLAFLAQHPGQALSRSQILEAVWGYEADLDSERTVNVHVRRLREKVELDPSQPTLILTVPGIGYRLVRSG